ncbi:MAG: GNAT family N-acetyltransferase [Bacteroidales bacterium]|nr:GNAT family N-acetyltransferase [Bacteroidales bacterium]
MDKLCIRSIKDEDKKWITNLFIEEWGSTLIIAQGKKYYGDQLPGFIAEIDGQKVGLITYFIHDNEWEIISLNSLKKKTGIGTSLVDAVIKEMIKSNIRRISLVTTNDNINALKFYQKRGFFITKVIPNAVRESRKMKTEIPLFGQDGIPIRDEIKLEMVSEIPENIGHIQ